MSPPAMLAVPASSSVMTTVGAVASSVKSTDALAALAFPATSVMTAVRLFAPSAPRSARVTVTSTWPASRSSSLRTTVFGGVNAAPPSRSSTVSPATGSTPVVGNVTRKVVLAASAAFITPSFSSLVPPSGTSSASVGAAGAVVSSVKVTAPLAVPTLPASSVIRAVRLFTPSLPRSAASTVKSTPPAVMSAATNVTVLGVAKAAPPRRSSTVSPAAANEPVVGSVTRKTVLAASDAFIRLSPRSPPCTASVGAAGAVVSTLKDTWSASAPWVVGDRSRPAALRMVLPFKVSEFASIEMPFVSVWLAAMV